MPRGYRSSVFVLVGWIALAGASSAPEQGQTAKNGKPASEISGAANTVATAIRKAAEPGEKDRGCEDRADKRNSDLCAQWKAADAARDAANYSFWTLFISTVGTALLVWTLWETRDTSRRQLRAYVTLKTGRLRHLDSSAPVEVNLEFVNNGQTPAYDVYVVGGMFVADFPMGEMLFKDLDSHVRNRFTVGSASSFFKSEKGDVPENYRQKLKDGRAILYVYGECVYVDAFKRKHVTKYRMFCGGSHPNWLTEVDGEVFGRLVPAAEGNNST